MVRVIKKIMNCKPKYVVMVYIGTYIVLHILQPRREPYPLLLRQYRLRLNDPNGAQGHSRQLRSQWGTPHVGERQGNRGSCLVGCCSMGEPHLQQQ